MRQGLSLVVFCGALALAAPAMAADYTVFQKDKAFSSAAITIKPGDRVTFTNADGITHNVYSVTKGHEFDLKTQAPGQSNTVPFPKTGSLDVECAIHPKMRLKLNVVP